MDSTLDFARAQFALTAGGHFLFVALTLGLAIVVAVTHTRATIGRHREVHLRMARFWGRLYVINYAVGIVTGLVMEFQFGLNWGGLMDYTGNTFGASLALETLLAFFVESTFLGLWIFGWGRLNRWVHLAAIWVVTLTAYVSAYFIMVANGLLQHPVGYELVDGRMRLTDPLAVYTNPAALVAFGHIVFGAVVVAGFFLAGVSAYHLFRRTAEQELFRRSLRVGVGMTLPGLLLTATLGGVHFETAQDMKLAAFGGQTSDIARLQEAFVAANGPGDYVPPLGAVQAGGTVMLTAFGVMFLVSVVSFVLMFFPWAVRRLRVWHVLLIAAVPLPYLAMIGGWVLREMGRQPWVVYGRLTTEQALSDLTPGQTRLSFFVFTGLFAGLVVLNAWMLARHARRGPDASGGRGVAAAPVPDPVITY
ncbi:cytochrome ubiquinol oxidase subunit I [Spongiactinospora sp. TRM90649]|uniref:cytochrome ubiquinol oxidase subunit I n=1 Tax=Spongiactinospora sp. TRM90649 TaxID=3031114 RepID=UPI0023F97458|nr:cytochrome ubiquinol oxidase subunit I [Spongiactinospora sp. TRM90649]MDF5757740.1 cytochrome ubiquinol oxidase subunit I [Spongiactinospora sp. TRM90649]